MSSKNTPNQKNPKLNYLSSAKFSTPTNTTPIKPVRSTLSIGKSVSTSLPRAGFVKQKSACDLRERYNLNGNDALNTAFTSTPPISRATKDLEKGKLTASSSSLSGIASKTTRSLFDDDAKSGQLTAKRLFSATKLQDNVNRTPECFSKVSFDPYTPQSSKKNAETPRNSQNNQANCDVKTKENSEVSNLTVAVRVRPMNAKECTTPSVINVISTDDGEVTVLAGTNADSSAGVSYSFRYDYVFSSYDSDDTENYANQETVFNGTTMPLINKAFEGYNACLFAYGQTGSGKSYSMMGLDTGLFNFNFFFVCLIKVIYIYR